MVKKRKILILDDEDLILELAMEILKVLGFNAVGVNNSQDAINEFKKAIDESSPFDLVLFDMTLAEDMNGVDVLKEIKKIDPDIKAIISTGYSADDISEEPEKYGFHASIPKPYSINKLKEVLEQVLVG